jgi:hypothetical protein
MRTKVVVMDPLVYTELTGVASRSAWRATLNTNTSTKLEAIEPRTTATIAIFSSVEF